MPAEDETIEQGVPGDLRSGTGWYADQGLCQLGRGPQRVVLVG